jgi:hypothetical protein
MNMARVERVNVMLEPKIKQKFSEHAEAMGLSDSALGAFVIGQWVRQQEMVIGPMLKMAKEMMEKEVVEVKKEVEEVKENADESDKK